MGLGTALDFGWGAPSCDEFRAQGAIGAISYLSYDAAKNWQPGDITRLHACGIQTAVIWETTANRAGQGYDAGVSDAGSAITQAVHLGVPNDRPIYFAVDFDADGSQVEAYFRGVNSMLGKQRTGVYAGIRPIDYLHQAGLADYLWQTLAWSGGAISPACCLYQRAVGNKVDWNTILKSDWGQYGPGVTPLPPPPEGAEDMPITAVVKTVRVPNAEPVEVIDLFVEGKPQGNDQAGQIFHTWQQQNGSWYGSKPGTVAQWTSLGTPGK